MEIGIAQQIDHAQESDRQAEGKNRHFNFNLMVSESDGQVVAEYAFMNVNAGHVPMAAKIVVTGRMRDTVVRTDAGWKIAHRFVRFDQNVQFDF
ncbi:nuclear transport factor 2 family protein [Sphingobium sp. HWE2-09]|uniref:nuclear transport factor 2 family protein n=1 Tax=Sphingobium sp. HWE2-09 TaxID=3108390 RepID=UPI002DC92C27|nr:nuclear transport factor 2 family protein [Sphingobium sp. HWE2-09]